MSRNTDIQANTDAALKVPRHIAIIMDGNGRWAQARGEERSAGHVRGVDVVRDITRASSIEGVKYLTLYAFSTENWNRPKEEVDMLMHLMVYAVERETPDLIKNNVQLHVIGDLSRCPDEARERLLGCVRNTAHGTGLNLILAISYSSRWEIARAARMLAAEVRDGRLDADAIDADAISAHLTTASFPDPDLLIRTGGDKRLSNFLLWQMAYGEIIFTDTYWPDFTPEHLHRAIVEYSHRQRRFGLTSEQIEALSTDGGAAPATADAAGS